MHESLTLLNYYANDSDSGLSLRYVSDDGSLVRLMGFDSFSFNVIATGSPLCFFPCLFHLLHFNRESENRLDKRSDET